MTSPRQIELLAPAKNADIAIEAIRHGADAVYIGPPANGARAAAANSLQEIERAVDFAHLFNARVYATVNTIIYESELKAVEKMIRSLYNIGVDALIVQDLGVLRMDIPPIALHASTQCDTRTPAKAKFLEAAGFSQIVPARELSLEETAAICNAVSVPIEVFVHGALCVSYSGDCYASYATTGRSANRGECAQLCRLPYTLSDRHGNILIADKHILSLKDLNRSAMLADLLKAGVSSFKIEGRLKDADYVKNVVAAYRRALDAIISANPEEYTRSSSGTSICSFTPALEKSFNRGFTTYFSNGPAAGMASFNSPKWVGEKIATVKRATPSFIDLDTRAAIANGDGLGYFDSRGKFCGFRVNRAEASRIFPAKPVSIKPGTEVYRNSDKAWADTLAGQTATRTIDISMTLRATADAIVLDITDEDSNSLTLSATCPLENAKAPPGRPPPRHPLQNRRHNIPRQDNRQPYCRQIHPRIHTHPSQARCPRRSRFSPSRSPQIHLPHRHEPRPFRRSPLRHILLPRKYCQLAGTQPLHRCRRQENRTRPRMLLKGGGRRHYRHDNPLLHSPRMQPLPAHPRRRKMGRPPLHKIRQLLFQTRF